MLDPPLRIFRCYICVENRLKAPLTDLSLLVEHLAMHFEFHLFECRGCDQKFATPFLANFHVKEGRCRREEGELCDDGGAPLKAVDLDTVEFEMFCHLQNAVTKCVELMLYELNCGENDLIDALNANKKLPECPISPEPIIREERQMQTSPPLDPAPTASVAPAEIPSPAAPPTEKSCSDMSLATTSTVESATKTSELADGCSFISDDEEEEPPKLPPVNSIEAEDGLSTVSNSPSSTVAPQTPPQTPPHSPPSTSTSSIPSLLSLKFNDKLDFDIPPRRDVRHPVFIPERPAAPPPTDFAEADSSSSSATVQQPFFFQAPPPKPKRTVSTQNLNSLNDPVYPVLAPVYSAGVRVFPGQPQLMHKQGVPGYSGQMQSASEEAMPSYKAATCYGVVAPSVGEVSSSTNCLPHHDERRLSDNLPVFPPFGERDLSPLRVESPVHGHLPLDLVVDGNGSAEDQAESQLSDMSLEEDGYLLDGEGTMSLDSNGPHPHRPVDELDPRPRIRNEEWAGYEERITEQRPGGVMIRHVTSQRISRNPRGEKQRYSYGIRVVRSFDPHSGTTINPRKRRNSSGRRSRALSRDRSSHVRSRTTGPPRSISSRASRSPSPRVSRSPSPRVSRKRVRSPSSSPMRRSRSVERSRRRHGATKEKFEIFPASILDGDMPCSSRDTERLRHRSRSRRRTESRKEDRDEEEDERPRKQSSSSKSSSRCSDIEVLEVIQHVTDRASRQSSGSKPSHFADWKKKQSKLSRVPIPPPLPQRKQ